MSATTTSMRRILPYLPVFAATTAAVLVACARSGAGGAGGAASVPVANVALASRDVDAAVERGRVLVLRHACGDCHGGFDNPDAQGFLAGRGAPGDANAVGPFKTWGSNLTPDSATGIGRYTERQLFNAMRYGLHPRHTPDVEITSATPGQGNFPAAPRYLAPPMPWTVWRHMSDQDLHDVALYLKRGLVPVRNAVPESEGPPDGWAGEYTVAKYGPYPVAAFPGAGEVAPPPERRDEVLRGRALVQQSGCADCHGGIHPNAEGYLDGMRTPIQEYQIGPFKTRARNITPDNTTGIGRFSERQLFNALRYGLRPGETPDVEITSTTPGQGNFPANPKFLAPPMPWLAWRHMSDQQLRDVSAYLKLGVRPSAHRVQDSDGPPDFWASEYAKPTYGVFPAKPFPLSAEKRP